jgi:acetyltransferase EpsM
MQTSGAFPVFFPAETQHVFWVSAIWVYEGQEVESGQLLVSLTGSQTPPLELFAPHSGIVTGLGVRSGQRVEPGEALCSIVAQEQPGAEKASLLICGGGGHGKAIIEVIRAMGAYSICGIVDDGIPAGTRILGITVLGSSSVLNDWRARGICLAVNAVGGIGNPAVRERVFEHLLAAGYALPPVVHPSAVVEASAVIEDGVHVLAQAYIGSAAHIGFGSVINAGAIVSHDCILGRVTNLSPGAALAGNVTLKDHAQIGMNASVNLHVTIGSACIVGNGATVKADVPAATRVWAGSVWPVRKS